MKPSYEELEARCAALAAENAGLKAAHPQPFGPVMMKALDAYEKHQDETPETGMLDAFFILRDSIRVDTTVTDAFLAEVRAEGAELYGNHTIQIGEEENDEDIIYAGKQALLFATQLREGAAK